MLYRVLTDSMREGKNMRKKGQIRVVAFMLMLSLILGLTACKEGQDTTTESGQTESTTESGQKSASTEKKTEEQPTFTGWTNTDIEGNVTSDSSARPQDDFALAMNKDLILECKIPEGYKEAGGMYDVAFKSEQLILDAIKDETITGHDAELVRDYFNVQMDWEKRNALGIEPARKYFEDIQSLNSLDDVTGFLKDMDRSWMCRRFVEFYIKTSAEDPDLKEVLLFEPRLILGGADEYRKDERSEMGKLYDEENRARCAVVLPKLGYTDEQIDRLIEQDYSFEKKLAKHIFTKEEMQDPSTMDKQDQAADRNALAEMAGSFPLIEIMDGLGYGVAERYDVQNTDYVRGLSEIYTEDNLEEIRAWLTMSAVLGVWDLVDKDTMDRVNAESGRIFGISGSKSDEQIALGNTKNNLAIPLDNVFIQKYCTPEMKEEISGLTKEIIDEYRTMLEHEEWLSEETRKKAIEKLDSITIRAVYPDVEIHWDDLTLADDKAEGNALETYGTVRKYLERYNLRTVNEKRDRKAWDQLLMPTSSANGVYNMDDNSINICAGFLLGGLYDRNSSREEKLAKMGQVIGHEISHAFDSKGSLYDKNGHLSSWWTEEDRKAFDQRVEKLIKYYDGLTPVEGVQYSGTRVQGEAIADLGAMKVLLSLASKDQDFDYEKFFKAGASSWAVKRVQSEEINKAQTDEHPLAYLRVNVPVQQFEEFYKTFDVKEGDGMYLAPEDRLEVW